MLQAMHKSSIEEHKPKKNFSKYTDSYLDFRFTFVLQNGEEKPQCVISNKKLVWTTFNTNTSTVGKQT